MSDFRAAEALYEYVRAMGFHGPDAKPWDERSVEHQELWIEAVRVVDGSRSPRVAFIDDSDLFYLRSSLFADRHEPRIIVGADFDTASLINGMIKKLEATDVGKPEPFNARAERRMHRPKRKRLMKGRP